MNIQEFNAARRVYLTDDEDILAACAVGVYRPSLRVHLPFGTSYYDLTAIERSALWAFERFLQRGELDDKTGTWIFRGIGTEPSYAETWNINLIGFRVLEAAAGYEDYEDMVDGESVDIGWAKFVHLPTAETAAAA